MFKTSTLPTVVLALFSLTNGIKLDFFNLLNIYYRKYHMTTLQLYNQLTTMVSFSSCGFNLVYDLCLSVNKNHAWWHYNNKMHRLYSFAPPDCDFFFM